MTNNKKVLIVDDQFDERNNLKKLLMTIDIVDEIDLANDGIQAKNMIKNNDYDLVILDLIMENSDGIEVLKFLQSLKKRPKIVIASAVGNSKIIKNAFNCGADYYFKKSFNFQNFKSVVVDFLSEKEDNQPDYCQIIEKIGIPPNLSGFKYINEILKIISEDRNITISQSYRMVSDFCFTSAQCVEANVRNAVFVAHKVFNENYQKLFSFSLKVKKQIRKPKNSLFLYTILNYINNMGIL